MSGQDAPSDPAHTFKGTGGGGIGLKSSDKYALPLSPAEHRKQSGMPELAYWREILVNRPILRGTMIISYTVVHSDMKQIFRKWDDPAWLDDIKTDDVLVKRLVQAFAEIGYYYQFTKGNEMP